MKYNLDYQNEGALKDMKIGLTKKKNIQRINIKYYVSFGFGSDFLNNRKVRLILK